MKNTLQDDINNLENKVKCFIDELYKFFYIPKIANWLNKFLNKWTQK